MAIGPAAYKLVADVTQFTHGATVSRQELSLLRKIMDETTPAVEKFSKAEEGLNRLLEKGVLPAENHARALSKIRDEARQATEAVKPPKTAAELSGLRADVTKLSASFTSAIPLAGQLGGTLAAIGPAAIAVGAAFLIAKAGIEAFQFVMAGIDKQSEKIDKLGKEALKLETSAAGLQAFRAAAAGIGNVDVATADKAIEKLTMSIAEAAGGSKQAAETFRKLGLDAKQMLGRDAVDNAIAVGDAIARMGTNAERLKAAQELAGKGGGAMLTTFLAGGDAIREQVEWLDKVGLKTDDIATQQIAAMRDAWTRVDQIQEGIWTQIAIEAAPLLEAVADTIKTSVVDSGLLADAFELIPPLVTASAAGISVMQVGIGLAASGAAAFVESLAMAARIAKAAPGSGALIDTEALDELLPKIDAFTAKLASVGAGQIASGLAGDIGRGMEEAIERAKAEAARKAAGIKTAAELAQEEIEAQEKATAVASKFQDQMDEKARALSMSARALEDYKLQQEGVDFATRQTLLAQYDEVEALKQKKKAEEDATKAAKELAEADRKKEESARKAAASIIADLEKQIATFRMTAAEKKVYDAQIAGADAAELARIGELQKRLDAMEEEKKKWEENEKAIKKTTDAEKKHQDAAKATVETMKLGSKEAFQALADARTARERSILDRRSHEERDAIAARGPVFGAGVGADMPENLPVVIPPRQPGPIQHAAAVDIAKASLDELQKLNRAVADWPKLEVVEETL